MEAREGFMIEELARRYSEGVRELQEALRRLEVVETRVATAAEAASATPPGPGVLAVAKQLRESLELGSYSEAEKHAEKLCLEAVAEMAVSLYTAKLEPDTCPDPRIVKLAASIVEAAGPLAPIVRSMIAGNTATLSSFAARVAETAAAWRSIAQGLTDIYAAATRLEKVLGIPRSKTIASLSDMLSGAGVEQLMEAAARLTEAAGTATEVSEKLAAATKASNKCGSKNRLHCRWLSKLITHLVAAREALEKLPQATGLQELRDTLTGARHHLRTARDLEETLQRLAEKLAKKPTRTLEEAITALENVLQAHRLTPSQEEVLEKLARQGPLELATLEDPRLQEAALTLCRKNLIRCTLRL